MTIKNDFLRIMNNQIEMELATSVNNYPNVRIINFIFDASTNIIFFTSFEENKKIKEFEENPNVSFTTIPKIGFEHVKSTGIVKKSNKTIFDISEEFINKIPEYKELVEEVGNHLILFEIMIDTAIITLDFENINTIKL